MSASSSAPVRALARRWHAARADQLLTNSALMLATTVLMAAGGAVFWVIAARLAHPAEIGLAGSLVAAGDTLGLFAQLGLNIALLRTLPQSTRQAADVVTSGLVVLVAGAAVALGDALLLPWTSPRLATVLDSPVAIGIFCVLVAATALNVLSDSAFLGLNRVWSYLRLNGFLMSLLKCVLPFLLAGAGALGLYGSVGGAIACCAAASVWVILRHLPGRAAIHVTPAGRVAHDRPEAMPAAVAQVVDRVAALDPHLVSTGGPDDTDHGERRIDTRELRPNRLCMQTHPVPHA